MIVSDTSKTYEFKLGQASNFPGGDGVYRGAKIELPDGVLPLGGAGLAGLPLLVGRQGGPGERQDDHEGADRHSRGRRKLCPSTWSTTSKRRGTSCGSRRRRTARPGPRSRMPTRSARTIPAGSASSYGFPTTCARQASAASRATTRTGPNPKRRTFDLAAFAGKNVWLRMWYMTDWGTIYTGPIVDNVQVTAGGAVLFADNAENGGDKWIYEAPWQRLRRHAEVQPELLPAVAQRRRRRRLRQRPRRLPLALSVPPTPA